MISVKALTATFRNFPVAISAFAALLFGHALAALRWYVLVRTMQIPLRPRAYIEIFAMGTFANTFLPGGTGGDLLRALYVTRDVRSDRSGAAISIIADRALGFFGLLAVAVMIGFAAPDHPAAVVTPRWTAMVLAVTFAAAALAIIVALVVVTPARFARIKAFVGMRTVVNRAILRIIEIAATLAKNPGAALICFGLSILIALTIVFSVILLSRGFVQGGLTVLDFSYAALLALIANITPITPGGIGVGESAFAVLCFAWEPVQSVLPYGTIFFGYRLLTMLIGLLGSIGFVTYRRDETF